MLYITRSPWHVLGLDDTSEIVMCRKCMWGESVDMQCTGQCGVYLSLSFLYYYYYYYYHSVNTRLLLFHFLLPKSTVKVPIGGVNLCRNSAKKKLIKKVFLLVDNYFDCFKGRLWLGIEVECSDVFLVIVLLSIYYY